LYVVCLNRPALPTYVVTEKRGHRMEPHVMAAAPERFVAWCKQEQASIEQELELLVSGKVRIGEDLGSGWIDRTADSIERAKRRLTE
jgi:hypothetical protein